MPDHQQQEVNTENKQKKAEEKMTEELHNDGIHILTLLILKELSLKKAAETFFSSTIVADWTQLII